jgi:outer membrane protein TolC
MNALAILTGQPPGALQSALSELGPVPAAPADLALAFPAETLLQRPDVRAAASRVDAAMARVAVAEAERHPNFKLSGSLGLSALTLGTLTDSASLVRALLASFSVPLYDGGARDAQLRSQEAALDQARSNGQGTVLTALQEVEDALASLRGNQDRLERLQASAVAANNADALARQRYQSGLIDFATVLTTQRTVLSAQDSLASAQASLSTDHVKLYKALGGGWQPNPPASTKP